MNNYKTSEVARRFAIHVNTVRLYEELGYLAKPQRRDNGYRIFTDIHMEQLFLIRTAFQVEILQNNLRKQVISVIQTSASGDFDKAIVLAKKYLQQIQKEKDHANEALEIAKTLLFGDQAVPDTTLLTIEGKKVLTRKETAEFLQITMDALRNWEMNGLLCVKRKQNGYRVYTVNDLQRLKIIRTLRGAKYSLSSILRMLNTLSHNPAADIRQIIDTPDGDDEIITACDSLLSSLQNAETNALLVLTQLKKMKKLFA